MCIAADKMDDSAAAGAPVLCQRGVRGTRMCCFVNKELRVLLYQVHHRSSWHTSRGVAVGRGSHPPSAIRGWGERGWGQGEGSRPRPGPRRAGARAGDGARGGRDSISRVRTRSVSRAALSHSLCPKLIAVVCALSSVYLSRDRAELTIEIEPIYSPDYYPLHVQYSTGKARDIEGRCRS